MPPGGALPLRATDDKPSGADTRSLAAQRDFLVSENTRSKNHLRNILLESCLELEARPSLSDPATLNLLATLCEPWLIAGNVSR